MKFIETNVFTKIITQLMSDDEYRSVQEAMLAQPGIGSIIKGTGGLRKFRWKSGNTGKRGGSRLIYYLHDIRLHQKSAVGLNRLPAASIIRTGEGVKKWMTTHLMN